MNRRSFFSFLAAVPVAVALPITATPDQSEWLWDGKAFIPLPDARAQDIIALARKWNAKSVQAHWE